jgi:uncharacterized phage infection (PIP) family protein YhgE
MKKIVFFLLLVFSSQAGCTLTDPEVMEMLQALQAQNDKLLEEITQMKGQLTALDGKYQTILAGLADHKKDIDALKGQIEALRTQIADQLKKIDQLNAQLTQQGADVEKLTGEIADLKKSIEDLVKLMDQLIGQIAPKIGDEFAGGIVFYLDPTSLKGLVVTKVNVSNGGTEWGCYCQDIKNTKAEVGSGQNNTKEMLTQCNPGQNFTNWSARIVNDIILNGYEDWYLPSKDELNLIYQNLHLKGIGNFSSTVPYWSSTQASYGSCGLTGGGWTQNFGTGQQIQEIKTGYAGTGAIRAIRSF